MGNLSPLPIAESSQSYRRIKAVIWEGVAKLQETHAASSALQLQYTLGPALLHACLFAPGHLHDSCSLQGTLSIN